MVGLRRGLLLLAGLVMVLCVVLLLNFTAANPTGRRYSSEVVNLQANNQEKGNFGEAILERDLNLPNNNNTNQRQCFCNSGSTNASNSCNVCLVASEQFNTTNYRLPDFVSPNFIADSKNVEQLPHPRDPEPFQISDFVLASRLLNRPLWIFVRVNTLVDPQFNEIVEATGGGIVYYFAVPGYVDPVDEAAWAGLMAAVPTILLLGVWEMGSRRRPRIVTVPARPAPKPDQPDPLRKANDASDFAQRAKDKAQRRIDIDEEYIDL